ncbi:MAG: serine/threonine-protein kinase [bacterium]
MERANEMDADGGRGGEGFVCAGCGAEAPTMDGDCAACGAPVALNGRYGLQAIVGRGAAGTTWRALDRQSGQAVAVKELPIRPGTPMTVRDKLHREARVLAQLDHDRIPDYVDDFEAGQGRHKSFYVVQSFVEGPTLAELAERRRLSQAEVVAILDEILAILEYLHGLAPPVIHRDLKPGNVIRRARDGKLVLIDFGAVRDVVTDPRTGGSTIAGTYGFMAPEQFRGHATAASDLYGVGALAVALLSRRALIDLVGPDHRLDWRPAVSASPGLVSLIARLLADEPGDRPPSAAAVRAALTTIDADAPLEPEADATGLPVEAMKRLRGALAPDEPILWVAQPKGRNSLAGARMMQIFAVPWTAFSLFWMGAAMGLVGGGPSLPGVLFSLFGLPFVGVGIGMLTAPHWAKKMRAVTVQAVTDRQALIVRGPLGWGFVEAMAGPAIRRYTGAQLAGAQRETDADGLSRFVLEWVRTSKGGQQSRGLEGVEDGDRVARLLLQAARWELR